MAPRGWERPQYGKPYLHVFILKKKFSRTSTPFSIKLGTDHRWVKRIRNYPIERPRGDNHKNAKIG
jgi:hypothetical protein